MAEFNGLSADGTIDDYAENVLLPLLKSVCNFADRNRYDRDSILAYTGHMITDMAEVSTIKHYEVRR